MSKYVNRDLAMYREAVRESIEEIIAFKNMMKKLI